MPARPWETIPSHARPIASGENAEVADTRITGALDHDGAAVGFFGTAPGARAADPGAASTAHNLGAIYGEAEMEGALNALGTRINGLRSALRTVGLLP